MEFKSLIIVIVGFQNFVCGLTWAVDLGSSKSSQEKEETTTPTRPVEDVVLTTKGLQERNTQMLDDATVKIGKIIN